MDPHLPDLAAQDHVIHSPSWGAAAFGPIYLLAMRAYVYALAFIFVALLVIARLFIDRRASLDWLSAAYLATAWVASTLGGKRIAWRTRRWQGFTDFLACQRVWDRWGKRGLALAAGLIVLARVLGALAVPRGPRAREVLEYAVVAAFGTTGAGAAWWYAWRSRQRLRAWQRLGLHILGGASALVAAVFVLGLLTTLSEQAASFFVAVVMFLGGVGAVVAAWQYGRRTARRLWWLRLTLRLLVLPCAFVAGAGVLAALKTLKLSDGAATAVTLIILGLGVVVVAWPALWRDPRAAAVARGEALSRPPPPRGVHLRTALDAVVLMVQRPLLMLPLLVTFAIQGQLQAMALTSSLPAEDPKIITAQDVARLWLVLITQLVLQAFGVAVVTHMTAQHEVSQRIALGAALRRALVRLPASLGAYLVFIVRILAGFVLLVIPGLMAIVRGALLQQAVVLGRVGPFRAIRVSGELVRGHWWRMFFLLAVEFTIASGLTYAMAEAPRLGQNAAHALEATWVAVTLTLLYLRLGGSVGDSGPQAVPQAPATGLSRVV